ncbi:MAG: FAD-dependent oxidoreductase [Alphaproteobacteria bacterium]
MKQDTVHIIGGGLVGALSAMVLAKRGFAVEMFERRGDMRKGAVEAGRSINLVLTSRGIKALNAVNLTEEAMKLAIPVRGRMLHDVKGNTTFVPYGQKDDEVIYSISRGELNKLLLTKAGEQKNVTLHFNSGLAQADLKTNTYHFTDGQKVQEKVALATDGAWSVARKAMLEQVTNFNYSQTFEAHGYKELTIPAGADGEYLIEKHALHIWPRASFMLMALPNLGGSFTVTLYLAYEGKNSFAQLTTAEAVEAFFDKHFPDAKEIMPTLAEEFFRNPTGSLATIRCAPWHVGDKLMLLGDAAHAIVPFFGQGMNCGFEDCTLLNELLDSENSWQSVFEKLEAGRKPNSDAIADMALENFVEMRDTTADPKFQLKKQIGFELEKRYPGKFIPRYAMVVFHPEIPYAEAQRRGKEQDKVLEALAKGISDLSQVDWKLAETLLEPQRAA